MDVPEDGAHLPIIDRIRMGVRGPSRHPVRVLVGSRIRARLCKLPGLSRKIGQTHLAGRIVPAEFFWAI
jgi:hypothetical protein